MNKYIISIATLFIWFYTIKICPLFAQIGINTETVSSGLIMQIDPLGNSSSSSGNRYDDDIVISDNGNVGIGTTSPQYKLHIKKKSSDSPEPLIKIADGSEKKDRIFMYSNGRTLWKDLIPGVAKFGTFSSNGVSIPVNTSNFINTGTYISLDKGIWLLNISLVVDGSSITIPSIDYNARLWLHITITDNNIAGSISTASSDIFLDTAAGYRHSDWGNLVFPYLTSTINAKIVINNTSDNYKNYYLAVGKITQAVGTSMSGNIDSVGKFDTGCSLYALKVKID